MASSFASRKRYLRSKRQIVDGCWVWTGKKQNGYGVRMLKSKLHHVHRIAAELWLDLEPDSLLVVHHTCQRRDCFNPDHLLILRRGEHIKLHHD